MLEIRFCLIGYGNEGVDLMVNMDVGKNFQRGIENELLPFMGIRKRPVINGVSGPYGWGRSTASW
jgi:hypothetical protein